jgi:YegS/Rv2252/BmrU family lipid kinase
MTRRVLLVANRHSRRGDLDLGAVARRLRAGGLAPEILPLPRKPGLDALLRGRGRAFDLVMLGGGDGTMNAAAAALLEIGRPLALLPLGTGNDLARTLGVPTDPLAAADLAVAGRTRRIDLGRVNDRYFFNVASVGLSVRVAKALGRDAKRRLGSLSYPLTVWRVLREGAAFAAEIRGEGDVHRLRTIQLAVGNGRFYGGGMVVDQEARIDDRLLHLYGLRPLPLWRLAWHALDLRRGRHDDPEAALSLKGRAFEIVTARPMEVNTDGEVTTRTPARFSVLPDALEVVVP